MDGTTTYNIRYDINLSLIWIKVYGILEADAWKQTVIDAVRASSEHGCNRLLYDVTDANIKETVFDIYQVAANLDEFGLKRNVKLAFVYKNNNIDLQFFETVANNRGFLVRFFEDTHDAVGCIQSTNRT